MEGFPQGPGDPVSADQPDRPDDEPHASRLDVRREEAPYDAQNDSTAAPGFASDINRADEKHAAVEVTHNTSHIDHSQDLARAGLIHVRDHVPSRDAAAALRDAAEAAAATGPRRWKKGTSRLGLLALLLGLAACALCRASMLPPNLRFSPTPPAAGGLALAFLALLGILFGSRAKTGVPLLAILLCMSAIAIAGYKAGVRDVGSARNWADGQVDRYRRIVDARLKDLSAPPAPRGPAIPSSTGPGAGQTPVPGPGDPSTPVARSARATPAQSGTEPSTGTLRGDPDPDDGIGAGSIFDMRTGTGAAPTTGPASPGTPLVPPPNGGAGAAPPAGVPNAGGSSPENGLPGGGGAIPLTPRVLSARAALQAAQAKMKAVEDDFAVAFAQSNDPAYQAAKAEVEAADKAVQDAKRQSDGYGQPRIDTTRQRKEAQEKVARIVNDAMANDPAVAAARRELVAAEEATRQAEGAAGREGL